MKWFTTFGPVEVVEQLLRLGRRGVELRPFCQSAGVQPRGYSRPLQRVLADFGAEASFGRAADRVKEHYRIDVPASAVRKQTLDHGRKLSGLALKPTGRAPRQIITQMDGSMVPVMQPGKGPDGRKAKLCCGVRPVCVWPEMWSKRREFMVPPWARRILPPVCGG